MSRRVPQPRVPVIVGPTAGGKTDLAVAVAEKGGGEVVSADSRQVFRHMDIGTATPDPSEYRGVVHHFISILDPHRYYSAGRFGKEAREKIDEILDRGKLPVIAGGSGLYVKAVIDGIFPGNYQDANVRETLRERAGTHGLQVLYRELQQTDPDAASCIHPNDEKRIVRALEVCTVSGMPFSRLKRERTVPAGFIPCMYGMRWPRDILYRRINERVDRMVENGLFDEVRRLLQKYPGSLNSLDSVGYKESARFLSGEISRDEAVELIKRNTRRFAKRQMSWFGKDRRIQWIHMTEPPVWGPIAHRIISETRQNHSTSTIRSFR